MDSDSFDRLARFLATVGPRRRLLSALSGLSLAGLVTGAGQVAARPGRRGHRHRTRHQQHSATSQRRKHHRDSAHSAACIPTGQRCPGKKVRGKKGKKLGCNDCCQGSFTTDATGKKVCGCQPNGGSCSTEKASSCCSGFCGGSTCQAAPCSAAIPCPPCQTCGAGGLCVSVPDGAACDDGTPCTTSTCQAGVCTGTPVICDNPPVCHSATGATCTPETGQCDYRAEADGASCGSDQLCCGGNCVDPQTDADHCGGCGLACPSGQTCQGGVCGVGCGSDFCPAASEICVENACQICDITCPDGECSGTDLQAKLSGGGAVYVCSGRYTGTFTLSNNLTVVGAGQGDNPRVDTILDADHGLVTVHNGGGQSVTLRQLRITGAKGHLASGVENIGRGSSLTMIDCTVAGNTTDDSEAAGVYNEEGVMTMTGCTVTDNHARGFHGRGGGGWSTGGSATMNDCRITSNTADGDGGGFLNFGDATFNGCTISHNTATIGGGLRNFTQTIILDATTVTLNTATVEGGGLDTQEPAILRNGTTITDNVPDNCAGCP